MIYDRGLKKYSVLIVDDECDNIKVLSQILSLEYTVQVEIDGSNAINTAIKLSPDVILLDIIMPEMDGYSIIEILKSSDETKDIPVIFISGLSNFKSEEKGLVLGAADYISKPFSPEIVKLRVGNQIKMLEQQRVNERLSMTDQLTDLPNRRSFDARFDSELKRTARERTPLSILLIDLDGFKNYNDTYGHQQGDIALKSFAAAFAKTLKRPTDFPARWGGEEFVALLSNTDSEGAIIIAEKIRRNIEYLTVPCGTDTDATNWAGAKITVSIGVNTWKHGDSFSKDELISGADSALYTAKRTGRNKVCRYESE